MTCGIYLLKNNLTGQLYVGQSKNIEKRFKSHINMEPNSPVDRSLHKYGCRSFEFTILCECDESELNQKEDEYMELYNTLEDEHHFNKLPAGAGPKNFYRLIKGGEKWILVGPAQKKLKYSKNKEELELLADKLNKNLITEDDLKKPKCYRIIKTGVKFGKQQYAIATPNNRRLLHSFDLKLLQKYEYELNNKILNEKYFEKVFKKYTVTKYGFKRGTQYYAIVDDKSKPIRTSKNKPLLEEFADKLNNNELTVDEVIIKKYRIVKNGKPKGVQRYSIKNPDGKFIKTSTDYEALQELLLELIGK